MFLDFFFLIIYAGVANKIAVFLKNYPNVITKISGVALFIIAIKILLTKNHI
jgi:threonine/homoserine/homoserine lactone efflux protein